MSNVSATRRETPRDFDLVLVTGDVVTVLVSLFAFAVLIVALVKLF